MGRSFRSALLASAALIGAMATTPARADAQEPPRPAGPAVGDMAPDFAILGATQYGLLREGTRLSDFRGKTVVLAFFARVRTRG